MRDEAPTTHAVSTQRMGRGMLGTGGGFAEQERLPPSVLGKPPRRPRDPHSSIPLPRPLHVAVCSHPVVAFALPDFPRLLPARALQKPPQSLPLCLHGRGSGCGCGQSPAHLSAPRKCLGRSAQKAESPGCRFLFRKTQKSHRRPRDC